MISLRSLTASSPECRRWCVDRAEKGADQTLERSRPTANRINKPRHEFGPSSVVGPVATLSGPAPYSALRRLAARLAAISGEGTMITGRSACCTTAWDTLPSISDLRPVRPRVPRMIAFASTSSASETIVSAIVAPRALVCAQGFRPARRACSTPSSARGGRSARRQSRSGRALLRQASRLTGPRLSVHHV
jgi:hypothetical protein